MFLYFFPKEVSVVLVKADGALKSPLNRLMPASAKQQLLQMAQARPGDLLLISAGTQECVVSYNLIWSQTAPCLYSGLLLTGVHMALVKSSALCGE